MSLFLRVNIVSSWTSKEVVLGIESKLNNETNLNENIKRSFKSIRESLLELS